MIADALIDPLHVQGTCHLSVLDGQGVLAGGTSTSGLAWKIPGRVGDSPILGAGLYVDGAVGSAGSTGRGEANLENLSSFWIVEEMRRGAHPKDAALAALRRIVERNSAALLRLADGRPRFNLQFFTPSTTPAGSPASRSIVRPAARWCVMPSPTPPGLLL